MAGPSQTALTALAVAVRDLGTSDEWQVFSVQATDPDTLGSDGRAPSWWVDVTYFDANRIGRTESRPVIDGQLRQPWFILTGGWRLIPPALATSTLGLAYPDLLDSDQAVQIADAAGGTAFCQQTGGSLGDMSLDARPDNRPTWRVSYSHIVRAGLGQSFTVELDARTGDILRTDAYRYPLSALARPPTTQGLR